MKESRIIYMLESVDLNNKSGVLMTKPEFPKNAPWHTMRVSLSRLLAHRIEHNKTRGLMLGQSFVGTRFCSTVNSKQFEDNPFTLVEFAPGKDSDVPHNFQLRLVTEKRGIQIEVLDLYKNKAIGWQNRSRRPSEFLRYELIEVMKKLKDCGELNIVRP